MSAFGQVEMLELITLTAIVFGSLAFSLALTIRRGQRLATVLVGLTLFHETLFVGFPIWHSAVAGLAVEREMLNAVGVSDLLRVLGGEALFCAGFAVAFALASIRASSAGESVQQSPERDRAEERTLLVLVVAGLVVYGSLVVTPPTAFEDMQLVLQPDAGILAQLAGWLNSLFYLTSLMAGALLLFGSGEHKRVGKLLGALLLCSVVYIGISSGARGRITWVVSVIFVAAVLLGRRRQIILSGVLASLAAPAVLALGSEARTAIIAATSLGASRADIVRLLIEAKREGATSGIPDEGAGTVLARRAEGPRNAVSLYRLHDREGAPGLGVYMGSLMFPVPRRLWPHKPAPGSVTGDFFDAAIYQTKLISYGSESEMGPVLASAHAYWEGGWTGVALIGILTGIFWGLVLRWSALLPDRLAIVVVVAFAASLLIDGFLTAFCPLWSFILTCWRWVIPLLVVYGTCRTLPNLGRRHRPSVSPMEAVAS